MARLETKSPGFVYLLACKGVHKIGVAKNPLRRLKALQTGSSDKITIVHTIYSQDAFRLEKYFHRLFAYKRLEGEWFALTPAMVDLFKRYQE